MIGMVLLTPSNTSSSNCGAMLLLEVMLCNPLQPEKASDSIEVTELGMVMEVSPLQPENASSPIEVTELGIIVF